MNKKNYKIIGCLLLLILAAVSLTACAQDSSGQAQTAGKQPAVMIERLNDVTDAEAAVVEQAAEATTQFFQESHLKLQQPLQLILVRGRQVYLSEVMKRFKVSEIEAARAIKGTDAVAGPGQIIINMDGVPSDRQKTFLTAHETTHQYQRVLAGNRAGTVKWLLEGMAETVGAQIVERKGYMTVAQYRNNWQSGLRSIADKPELAGLRAADAWSSALSRYGSTVTYKTAGLAVLVLTERFGQEKVLAYFGRLGKGESAEDAFYHSFGMTLADFEAEMTSSLKKAA